MKVIQDVCLKYAWGCAGASLLAQVLVAKWADHQPLQRLLPKSPSGAAVRFAPNLWEALTHFLEEGELEIDNGATERADRGIALGRGDWTFFGSVTGGKTAAVLRSFVASCKRCDVELRRAPKVTHLCFPKMTPAA
jgi:hypothetical protein